MSTFNQPRKIIITGIALSVGLLLIFRLLSLQVFSNEYSIKAYQQGIFRKVVYPDRGIIYDRNGHAILRNTIIYDLTVTPGKLRKMDFDTAAFCEILSIDTAEFNKRIRTATIRNSAIRPSTFEPTLSDQVVARLSESMYKWEPAFYLQERPSREYPYAVGGNILGYLSEVSPAFLESDEGDGYRPGDYMGQTGLERSYEKVLMGQRGIEYWKRDNMNRLTDRFDGGKSDTPSISGQNLHLSLDVELQEFGEQLMQNKVGAIVAIDPKTGGILAMVSSPTYDPDLLSGSERRKNFGKLLLDPRLPMINRTVNATYSPGSTFKTLQGLIGLQEGIIDENSTVSCSGAFYGCRRPMRCLDPGVFKLEGAITFSCNTYFATVMQRAINNPAFGSTDSGLRVWDKYMYGFGLGHKLGVDIPSEKPGLIPTPEFYNKRYGEGRWNFCTFMSVSIGQGEVNVTPIQMANEIAYIANKGYYYTPHLVDSIDGGDKYGMLDAFKVKHESLDISDAVFEAVHSGMEGVMDRGTGRWAKVPGIRICGKTGTVENYYKGKKQRDHAVFTAFAPREDPKIAIAVICENAGFGSTTSAPIASLMIEKYLRDSITDPARIAKAEALQKMNLIPLRMLDAIRVQDSTRKAKLEAAERKADSIRKAEEKKVAGSGTQPENIRNLSYSQTTDHQENRAHYDAAVKDEFIIKEWMYLLS